MDNVENIAQIMDNVENEIYLEQINGSPMMAKSQLENMIYKYFSAILQARTPNGMALGDQIAIFCKKMVEHLTGNYNYGLGDKTFEELDDIAKSASVPMAYSDLEDHKALLDSPELPETIIDGNLMIGAIPSDSQTMELAEENYSQRPKASKEIFGNAIAAMQKAADKFFSFVDKMDNSLVSDNIKGLFSAFKVFAEKRHFVPLRNSEMMQEIIENEGLIHFGSLTKLEHAMEIGSLRASNVNASYYTKGKAFFFAGVPNFERMVMNIPIHDVMTALRIRPTQEQMDTLSYRALSDKAVVHDGALSFSPEQAEIVYYGLKYDKENNRAYYGEITKEEAEHYKVADEVKRMRMGKFKANMYALAIDYKHHKKITELKEKMKEHGIDNFYQISSEDLDRATEIEEYDVVTPFSKAIDFIKESVKRVPISLINIVAKGIVKDYSRTKEKEADVDR